jgi:hypothetical protein
MRKEMVSILGVMAIAALILVAFQYQANAQSQQNDEVAVIGLFEQEASGYSGIATLRSSADQPQPQQQEPPEVGQTEVIVGILTETGLFDIFDDNDEGISRTAGIHAGTCDTIGMSLFEIGTLMRLGPEDDAQQQDDQIEEDIEGRVYAVKGMVETGMEELLAGGHVLVVFEHDMEDEEAEPEAIACGVLHPEFQMDPVAPMP